MTTPAAPTPTPDRRLERWQRFRAGREQALATPHGWLTLTGFHWLPATPSPLPGLPGRWSATSTTAALTAGAAEHVTLVATGAPVDGTVTAQLADEESLTWVAVGSVVVELGMRAGRYMVRPRDAAAPTLTSFTGVPVFDYDPAWVLDARFAPFDAPRPAPIATAHPEVPGVATLVGEVVFELAGTTHRLAAEAGALDSLVVTFHDASNGATTAPWRKVELTRPRPDGSLVLDFNRAINYPSAFTPFGTCPAPVAGNTLPVAVPAGERRMD